MSSYYACNGGTELIYEEIKGASFNSIELWIKFGSAQDPIENIGLAHLIEHLLIPENLLDVDFFGRKNAYATTSKERIRIYTKVRKEKTLDVLECFLQNIASLNSSEYKLEYERLKVLHEILYLKKTSSVLYIQEAEKELFKGSGYGNLIAGKEDGVKGIDIDYINTYLRSMIKENGLIVSISGEVDIAKVKKSIEKNLPSTQAKETVSCIETFNPKTIESNFNSSGVLYIFNSKRKDIDLDLNYILDTLLEEFIIYRFIKEPITIKRIDYNLYKFLTIFIPNPLEKKELIFEIYKLSYNLMDENMFNIVKSCIYDNYEYMSLKGDDIAYYNANRVFSNRKYTMYEMLLVLKIIDKETFKKHIASIINKDNTIKVIGNK